MNKTLSNPKNTCDWYYSQFDYYWVTECENAWEIIEGNPKENGMNFCPFCGKELIHIEFEDDDE